MYVCEGLRLWSVTIRCQKTSRKEPQSLDEMSPVGNHGPQVRPLTDIRSISPRILLSSYLRQLSLIQRCHPPGPLPISPARRQAQMPLQSRLLALLLYISY